jgi:hypothetical protein
MITMIVAPIAIAARAIIGFSFQALRQFEKEQPKQEPA